MRRIAPVILTLGLGVVTSALATVGATGAAPAVASPDTVWTWGGNGFGQLGDGSTVARRTPAPVGGAGSASVVDVHGGREHVATLRADGTVWVWGSNASGALGLGTTADRTVPTQVPGLTDVVAVETGHNFTLALQADGSVWSWGLNSDGQLGDGSTTLRRSPVRVVGIDDAVAVAGGRDMSFALRADGTVLGWGRNDEGQLGDGTATRRTTPVRVGGLTGVTGLAGGRDHGLALREDGTVWAWGSNDFGQVGDGTTTDRRSPVQVTDGAREVMAGAHHSYALRTDGTVRSWGRNYRANLGDGTTTQRTRPVAVLGVSGAVTLGSGRDAGMVTLADGRLMAWGHNASGQIGDGTTTDRPRAVVVPGITGATLAGGGGSEYAVVLVGSEPPANRPPVASFTVSCAGLTCVVDGRGSSDPDGTVSGYAWSFGDGATGTGPTASRTYATAGPRTITLVVTDDDGDTGTTSRTVSVAEPADAVAFRAASYTDVNSAQPAAVVPAAVQPGDQLVAVLSTNRAAALTVPAGWTVLGTAQDGADLRSWVLTRTAVPGVAGSTVRFGLDAMSKTSVVLTAHVGAGPVTTAAAAVENGTGAAHAAPAVAVPAAGATVLRAWVDKTSTAHGWTLPAGYAVRASGTGTGSGLLSATAGDVPDVPAGTLPAVSATAAVASGKALGWSVVLPPA